MTFWFAVAVAYDHCVSIEKPMPDSDGALTTPLDYGGDLDVLGMDLQLLGFGPGHLRLRRVSC
jgi:hypothetical protein